MENHDAKRHPGPWLVMQVDSEFAGLLVAVGFLVMGLVSMPLATGFVLAAIVLGVIVALVLRFTPRKFSRVILGTVIVLAVFALWTMLANDPFGGEPVAIVPIERGTSGQPTKTAEAPPAAEGLQAPGSRHRAPGTSAVSTRSPEPEVRSPV